MEIIGALILICMLPGVVLAGACWVLVSFFEWITGAKKKRREAIKNAVAYNAQNTFQPSHFKTDRELKDLGAFKKGPILVGYSFGSKQPIYYSPQPGQLKPLIYFGAMGSGKTSAGTYPVFSVLALFSDPVRVHL